jgi:uncharacterized protein YjiS (DUF1127 family)
MVILKAVLDVLVEAQDRARRHNDLATLDDRILADVGLSRHEADHATKWLIK